MMVASVFTAYIYITWINQQTTSIQSSMRNLPR
jgi:hypothetical protein